MPEPEQEMSRAELKQLADLVLGGKIQDDKDLQEAKSILEAHGVQHPYTAMHDDQDKSAFQREIAEPIETFADHYMKSFTAGAVPHMTEAPIGKEQQAAVDRQARHAANPGAAMTGTVLGYMSPVGAAGLISNAMGAGIRRLPGMAARMSPTALQAGRPMAGLAQRMATSVPVGAASDAAVTAAEKGVAAAAGEDTGDWTEDLTRAVVAGAIGGPVGELVSSAGQAAFHGLRETDKFMPYMKQLEEGGGGPRVAAANVPGLGKPEGFDEVMRRARAAGSTSATERAAEEAAPHVGRAIGEADAAVKARQEAFNESYYTSAEGRTGQPTDEILDALVSSMTKRGESIFRNEGELGKLRNFIENATEVVAVPRGGVKPSGSTVHKLPGGARQARQLLGENAVQDALARSSGPGTALARQGTALGSPRIEQETWARVNDPVSGAPMGGPTGGPMGAPGGGGASPEFDFYVVPKKVDARTLDTITDDLKTLVGEGFPDAAQFQRAAFKVRDKFPGNDIAPNPAEPEVLADGTKISSGWSYAKRKMTRELGELETTKKASGLRADESVVDVPRPASQEGEQVLSEQVRRIAKGLQSYGNDGTSSSVRYVQRLLKENPAGADAFRRFLATKAYSKVRDAVGFRSSAGVNTATGNPYFFTQLGDVMKMRMDPVARQAMKVTPELGGRLGVPLESLQLLDSLLGRKEDQ